MRLIDGKALAASIRQDIKKRVEELSEQIRLAVILVGNDPASGIYVNNKIKACQEVGIDSILLKMGEDATEEEIVEAIEKLNDDDTVDGILIQLPLPKGLDEKKIVNKVSPEKDVDALTYTMQGKLAYGNAEWAPCTPYGVIRMLDAYGVEIAGKNAVVIGRSVLCGKPLAVMLTERNATVALCHRKTTDLAERTRQADIIAVCTGKVNTLTADMVKQGAVVIDIGVSRTENGIRGDVDFENVAPLCDLITPVPGGVGPMTIASLLENTLKAHFARIQK